MSPIEQNKPAIISRPYLLAGEGKDEVRFFTAILHALGLFEVQVEDYKGKEKLRGYLETLPTRSGFVGLKTLVIVRDADDNPVGASQSLADSVSRLKGQLESKSPPVGVCRIETLVLPGEGKPGALEDVVLKSIPKEAIWNCITAFFECRDGLDPETFPKHTPAERAKAQVHVWLSAQKRPNLRLGEAAEAGLIDWSSPAFNELRAFLESAFGGAR